MFEAWSFLKAKPILPDAASAAPRTQAAENPGRASQLLQGSPLDLVGQQSESVRDRVNGLAERLDDLQSLSADFALIIGPLNAFVEQHAASRAKLMEVEALLERERELSRSARAELDDLHLSHAKISGDLQEAVAALRDQEERIRHQDTQAAELRIRVGDLKNHSESLDDRLFAEMERSKTLSEDNAALRAELEAVEDARAQADRQHEEAREMIGLSEAECARLQHLTESMAQKLSGFNRTVSELEPQLHAARAATASLQGKLAAEQSARQKSEAARDAERSAHEIELASLSMKMDGLNAHVVNTDKLLVHVREQLRDRSEALRSTDKNLKDVLAEKLALERRTEAALDSAARAGAQFQEFQRANAELKDRCDMLSKAVSAKDQALDSANRKSAGLLDRIEQLNARFQQERSEFEVTHRRMIEELQNERAERSLAHGALDIARKSRSTLLAQYTALKRQTGTHGARAVDDEEELDAELKKPPVSNVMPFSPPE